MTFALRASLLAVALCLGAGAAPAAVVLVADAADFPGGGMVAGFPGLPTGASGPVTIGAATLSAASGLFADGGPILSTTLDSEPIEVTFADPVFGFAFSGGIVGETFGFLAGELSVTIDGATARIAVGASSSFVGVLADAPFTRAQIMVADFDRYASSVAFVGLDGFAQLAAIPVPAPLGLLAAALGALAVIRRRAGVALGHSTWADAPIR